MSYFICIAFDKSTKKVGEIFLPPFQLVDMKGTPIGQIVSRGTKCSSYIITLNQVSESMLDKGPKNDRCSNIFSDSIKIACQYAKSVTLLLRFFNGNIYTEKVNVCSRIKIDVLTFASIFPNVTENVLYIIYDSNKYQYK